MLIRRLYSSLPSTRAGGSHSTISSLPTNTKPQTRGRIKPRLTPAICKSRTIKPTSTILSKSISTTESLNNNGKGRGRRNSIRQASSNNNEINLVSDSNRSSTTIFDEDLHGDMINAEEIEDYSNSSAAPYTTSSKRLLFTHPKPSSNHINEFKPIHLYPEQFKLHYTFTNPNYPLPLNLGTSIYTLPRKTPSSKLNVEDIFDKPLPPNPVNALKRKSKVQNGLNDHMRVLSNLSHPSLLHHLGGHIDPWSTSPLSSNLQYDNELNLSNQLSNKLNEMKETNDNSWNQVLAKLEGKQMKEIKHESKMDVEKVEKKDANLSEVVDGLNSVLSKLGLSSSSSCTTTSNSRGRKNVSVLCQEEEIDLLGEQGIFLDSVKRKRKKKISKHKYKKRRKATRALRKRLGK
ncbi:uncharacterized protein L201_000084 [Kwoniella dendrophila CBS 6074]|uniref:Ribosomal protein mS38 C-terminal domain-containing protein n=1 Tax=Kwoniella dendrophila CBS 6074 TaxID=1295534 RepID=A0AAX4JIG0_9TREE